MNFIANNIPQYLHLNIYQTKKAFWIILIIFVEGLELILMDSNSDIDTYIRSNFYVFFSLFKAFDYI